tara:strand:- start:1646 stop:2815 length:1170 start_codon:yes stop_codon:yes gene_type:complete
MRRMNTFKTEVLHEHPDNHARITKVSTPHGEFTTPCFMPVATRAYLNLMTPRELSDAGSQIILGGNTYHMLLTPGMDVIREAGGMHPFMGWQGPMLTDSGGFQVFSLSKDSDLCRIDDDGAHFKHPKTGEIIHMTPEVSLETQKIIGADIIMAFDQCTPDTDDKKVVVEAMDKTHRWLQQCVEYQDKHPTSAYGNRQALFGIIQGAYFRDLREQCAETIVSHNLDGIAIGGESIGFDMQKTVEIVSWVRPLLPRDKLRYTMGVGMGPQDLLNVVEQGIDVFDCVAPTRNARHGALYNGRIVKKNNWIEFVSDEPRARLNIKKAIYAKDERPIMEDCDCYTCQTVSRSYMHYLFREKSVAYSNFACIHNVHVMNKTCEAMRDCINGAADA